MPKALNCLGWKPTHIFNTHHHADHIGGNAELKRQFGCTIVGPAADRNRIPDLDVSVGDGDTYRFGSQEVRVFRNAGPYQRPYLAVVPGGVSPVLRRYPVRSGLRPVVRGNTGADVELPAETAGAASGDQGLLRT